ncbi:hypothetical protein QN277_003430 [Acacia crassicarpa]|uniref:Uncharacterized protein n=1 Tax=Acacia crassicarpa TaxID=499986 RepID=A0AAE1MCF9_9FABA|nr:hypothetical protein QN277_003430 [Acacia crassicarpa]
MKLAFYLLMILAVFKVSTGSNLITESCRVASKGTQTSILISMLRALKASLRVHPLVSTSLWPCRFR